MNANRAKHTIKMMCDVLSLSRGRYYKWLLQKESERAREDRGLIDKILQIHLETKGIYGAPRIHAQLKREGMHIAKKRVARLMREVGISGVTRRKRWRTTIRDHKARPAPDLIDRRFTASRADQLWVADITEIPTCSSKLYLAVVIDAWSRKVVGWSTSTQMPAELVIDALEMAVQSRGKPQGVIHHSDQGSQYTSRAFNERCSQLGVRVSMGSVGDCHDNAMAESFFATLECELLALVLGGIIGWEVITSDSLSGCTVEVVELVGPDPEPYTLSICTDPAGEDCPQTVESDPEGGSLLINVE